MCLAMQKRQCISIEIHKYILHLGRRNHPGAADDNQNLLQFVNQDDGEIRTVFIHVQTVRSVGKHNAFSSQACRCYQIGKSVLEVFQFLLQK